MKHRWKLGSKYAICVCGVRYRLGMVTREYEWPDGRRTDRAHRCLCDCQNPEPPTGAALVSNECPIHNDRPQATQ